MDFHDDESMKLPPKKAALMLGLFGLLFAFGWLQHTFGGFWWIGCAVLGVGLFFAVAWDIVAIHWLHRTGKPVESRACPISAGSLPAGGAGADPWTDLFKYKPENWPGVLLGWLIGAGLCGLAYLFWLLQQTHGGFWWIGIVVVAVSPVLTVACMLVSIYGLHKIGEPVHPGACPSCAAPLPTVGIDAGRWQACPRCGVPVANIAALTFGRSKGFVWCKRVLISMCVLLSPVVVVSGTVVLLGVGRFLGGRHYEPSRDDEQLLHAGLATLAYCFLAVATWLFGRAAFLNSRRRRCVLMAFGTLLTAGLLAGVVVHLCLTF
jgi:hypothetical protein